MPCISVNFPNIWVILGLEQSVPDRETRVLLLLLPHGKFKGGGVLALHLLLRESLLHLEPHQKGQ